MSTLEDLEQQVRRETQVALAATGVDILQPQHFVSIVRGRPHVRNTGVNRECKVEMLTRNGLGAKGPVAVFGCRATGWFNTCEVALLDTGKRVLSWRRKSKQAEVAIDGRSVGRIELGWCLRHAYIGSGCVWLGGEPFCRVTLPILGPSSPQPRDCTGRATFTSDGRTIKFVINPNDAESSTATMGSALAWGWARLRGRAVATPEQSQPGQQSQSGRTIFYASDQARLAELSDEQRLILLAIAVWPWSLYKGGGT
jgi:hypothetical protein